MMQNRTINLGMNYDELGRHSDAIEAYKQAILIKPDYAEAHLGLGLTYLNLGDKSSALVEYKILKYLDTELANKLLNYIYIIILANKSLNYIYK